jgi:FlaA1/EpsC-like NDP-sugar epimerase
MERDVSFLQKVYLKLPVITFDILAIPVAWLLASEFLITSPMLLSEWQPLCALMGIQIACYYGFRVYRGVWRFSSINDVFRIIKSVMLATVMASGLFYQFSWLHIMPLSVLPLYALILTGLLCGARLVLRHYSDKWNKRLDGFDTVQRVLIVGAGSAGDGLVREMQRTKEYLPIGIVDDARKKRGLELHGVRVLGTVPQLQALAIQSEATLIVIAIPSVGSADMRRIVEFCESCHVPFRTLPSLDAMTSGHVEINTLKTVKIEDLLGRDQVNLEWDRIESGLQARAVLVTGAGGSIGSELCRQIAMLQPSSMMLLDNSEANLFHLEREMRDAFPKLVIKTALVSVVDKVAVQAVFEQFRPAVVFHAAAYKHVPMLEHQTRVAVRNNVLGTRIVAEASIAVYAEKFILISTDKAVNPTNVMGTTKRVAEIYCQNVNARVDTQFITVRFGNVLGSVGSVVPLFQKQLKAGGPLTVTHPEVQRYFMTIPEASQLILQAMVNGEGGEIFVLDMGDPIKITYLAEQMIRLAGKEPGVDIQIEYTGLRPGEKLFEELFHPSEQLAQTAHEKLFKARFRAMDWDELIETFQLLQNACNTHENDEIIILLKSLVPEFQTEAALEAV